MYVRGAIRRKMGDDPENDRRAVLRAGRAGISEHNDTIVVGAGTSGCVLATRLIQQSDQRVLLVEAGGDRPAKRSLTDPRVDKRVDWRLEGYTGFGGHKIWLPRGKTVGGTSLLQGAIALRGFVADYTSWATVAGRSWDYEAVLPWMKKLERDQDFVSEWHGQSGPISIQRPEVTQRQPLHETFAEACLEASLPWCEDFNAPGGVGVGPAPLAQEDGLPQDVRRAYLGQVLGDPRLSVRCETVTRRLVWSKGRVIGIEVANRAGDIEVLRASQIVISAGAVNSPALLLRSGVGPPEELLKVGVKPRLPLPGVGKGLRDHPTVWVEFGLNEGYGAPEQPWFQILLRHQNAKSYPLPDCSVEAFYDFRLSPSGLAYRRGIVTCALLSPTGTGSVGLRPRNGEGLPVVHLGYDTPDNLSQVASILRFVRSVLRSRPFRRIGPVRPRIVSVAGHGGRANKRLPRAFGWDEFWALDGEDKQLVPRSTPSRHTTQAAVLGDSIVSAHHLHGGCSMAADSAESAVVNPAGRVWGLDNVFVADASIIPITLRANTHIPAILVGEMIATSLLNIQR